MEENPSEKETVDKFVKCFTILSALGRKEAIKSLVSTLDSDEMDLVIEAIDSKIDAVASQNDRESLEDSGVSSISPSETLVREEESIEGFFKRNILLQEEDEEMEPFYPSVQIEEGSQSLALQQQKLQCPIDLCEFETTFPSYLKAHVKSIHSCVKCNQCDFNATKKSELLKHVREVHGVDRYPCTKCEYKATQKANLQRHIDSVHEGIRYNCEYCSYTATRKDHLSRHVKQNHSNALLTK